MNYNIDKNYKILGKDLFIYITHKYELNIKFNFNNYDVLVIDSFNINDSSIIKACDMVSEFESQLKQSVRYKRGLTSNQYSRIVNYLENIFDKYKKEYSKQE